jgi:5'-nucleotidase
MTGAQTLAVDDAHAAHLVLERVDEELPQGMLRLGNREAVQVDLALHAILTAPQSAQHPELYLRATKHELLTTCQRRVGAVPGEALLQHGGAVGAREARARPHLRRLWCRRTGPERPHTAHCLPEQACLVGFLVRIVIAWGNHARSAATSLLKYSHAHSRRLHPFAVKILVSNDDGFRAEGIRRLREALATLGEVTVVAPDRNKSGASNSLTLDVPLRVFESEPGVYFVPGTPTDCVHLAISGLFDFEHDMVVSGVNDGANLGDDVLYSGTVAAAVEGRFLGLPTIAVSLCTGAAGGGHFETGAEVARRLVAQLLKRPLQSALILNVNVPDVPFAQLRGFRASRLGYRHRSEPVMRAQDPRGRPVYWIGPAGAQQDAGPGTDFDTVAQGYVSVTPLQVDLTRHAALSAVTTWLEGVND